jgi:hypothetical protein
MAALCRLLSQMTPSGLSDSNGATTLMTRRALNVCCQKFTSLIRRGVIQSRIGGAFRVIVSVQLVSDPPLNKNVCTVRFHKVRPHQVWLDDDLENYQEEAVIAMDFESVTGEDW